MAQAASTAAAAAVAALQQVPVSPEAIQALGQLLHPAVHCSINVACSNSTVLCSGNLVSAAGATVAAVVAGPSLARACMLTKRSKVLRLVSSHCLEDVKAITAASSCSAILCLPLLAANPAHGSCSAKDSPCIGSLTIGFQETSDISGVALKGALQLAHALALEQRQPLCQLSALVSSMLLPGSAGQELPAAETDSLGGSGDSHATCSQCELESEWHLHSNDGEAGREGLLPGGHGGGSSSGVQERGRRRQARGAGGNGANASLASPLQQAAAAALGGGGGRGVAGQSTRHAVHAVLGFGSRDLESQYEAYLGRILMRVDMCAYLMVWCFFIIETLLPGTPFRLAQRMGWRCLLGTGGLLPGLLLLTQRSRQWYSAHRDLLIASNWAHCTLWMTLGVANHMHMLDREAFRSPLFLQSFGWLTGLGLSFQLRFRFQALLAPAAFAVNAQLLPAICREHYEDQPPHKCLMLGLLKASLHGLLLPLACCYVFDCRMRRLFLRSRHPAAGAGAGS